MGQVNQKSTAAIYVASVDRRTDVGEISALEYLITHIRLPKQTISFQLSSFEIR